MEELGIGIVSGIITATLLFGFQRLYLAIIRPWFEDRVYKDARIEGRWSIEYPQTSGQSEEQVTLRRTAHRVTGQVIGTKGPDSGKAYDVEGTFRNLLLTLTYTASDSSALDRGTFVLQLNGNGKVLDGRTTYYHDDHTIRDAPCTWRKIST